MIPTLFSSGNAIFNRSNGLGGLPDAISCVVTEKRNTASGYYLEMDYPVNGLHADLLAPERIIVAAPSKGYKPQPFRISRITKPIDGIIHIYAPHVSDALRKMVIYGTVTGTDVQSLGRGLFNLALTIGQVSNFSFSSNITTSYPITVGNDEPIPMMDTLLGAEGSILDLAGGEYEFDEWDVILHQRRGVDSGIEIRYGVNMMDMQAETDDAEMVTAVVPYWKGNVNDVETVIHGAICSSTNAASYSYLRCVPLDVSDQFQLEQGQTPSQSDIEAKGQAYINSTNLSALTMSIDVTYESITDGIGERPLHLCDTVRVVHPDLGVSSTAKIVETRFNVLTEKYDGLTIGTIQKTIVDTIADLDRVVKAQKKTFKRR